MLGKAPTAVSKLVPARNQEANQEQSHQTVCVKEMLDRMCKGHCFISIRGERVDDDSRVTILQISGGGK